MASAQVAKPPSLQTLGRRVPAQHQAASLAPTSRLGSKISAAQQAKYQSYFGPDSNSTPKPRHARKPDVKRLGDYSEMWKQSEKVHNSLPSSAGRPERERLYQFGNGVGATSHLEAMSAEQISAGLQHSNPDHTHIQVGDEVWDKAFQGRSYIDIVSHEFVVRHLLGRHNLENARASMFLGDPLAVGDLPLSKHTDPLGTPAGVAHFRDAADNATDFLQASGLKIDLFQCGSLGRQAQSGELFRKSAKAKGLINDSTAQIRSAYFDEIRHDSKSCRPGVHLEDYHLVGPDQHFEAWPTSETPDQVVERCRATREYQTELACRLALDKALGGTETSNGPIQVVSGAFSSTEYAGNYFKQLYGVPNHPGASRGEDLRPENGQSTFCERRLRLHADGRIEDMTDANIYDVQSTGARQDLSEYMKQYGEDGVRLPDWSAEQIADMCDESTVEQTLQADDAAMNVALSRGVGSFINTLPILQQLRPKDAPFLAAEMCDRAVSSIVSAVNDVRQYYANGGKNNGILRRLGFDDTVIDTASDTARYSVSGTARHRSKDADTDMETASMLFTKTLSDVGLVV